MAWKRSGRHNDIRDETAGGVQHVESSGITTADSETDLSKMAEKHLGGLTKLLAIPLPLRYRRGVR